MQFTPEEESLLMALAQPESGLRRLGFYSAVLFPILAFGAYGMILGDTIALSLAFAGLAGFIAWHISSESNSARIFDALSRKLLAAKVASGNR